MFVCCGAYRRSEFSRDHRVGQRVQKIPRWAHRHVGQLALGVFHVPPCRVLCIVHGADRELLEGLVMRVREALMPEILKQAGAAEAPENWPVIWPEPSQDDGERFHGLVREFAVQLGVEGTDDVKGIYRAFLDRHVSVAVRSTIYARKWSSKEPDLIRHVVFDKATALTAAQAITAALLARDRGAGGQHVRLAMLDAALAFFWPDGMMNQTFLGDGVMETPSIASFYRVVASADGHLTVTAITDDQFAGLCRALERPELAEDPRYRTIDLFLAPLLTAVALFLLGLLLEFAWIRGLP